MFQTRENSATSCWEKESTSQKVWNSWNNIQNAPRVPSASKNPRDRGLEPASSMFQRVFLSFHVKILPTFFYKYTSFVHKIIIPNIQTYTKLHILYIYCTQTNLEHLLTPSFGKTRRSLAGLKTSHEIGCLLYLFVYFSLFVYFWLHVYIGNIGGIVIIFIFWLMSLFAWA